MISERIRRQEEVCCTWFWRMTVLYVLFGAGLAVSYAVQKNWYLMAQSLGTLAALGAIFGLFRALRIRPVYSFNVVVVGFTFAAYTLGVACAMYKLIPGYDKLLHMLSGTLTMMLALPLYYVLKAGHRVEKSDCALAVGFCMMCALAVAGVWEIAEYALSLIAGIDPQCVQTTGVADTMQDMIVCLIGAAAGVPPLIRFYRTGKSGVLYAPAAAFIEKNLFTDTVITEEKRGDRENE